MKGKIINYRRGRKTEYTNQYVVEIEGVKNREDAENYLGKKVVWTTSSGKRIIGKITRVHGKKGAVIARFSKGLPGQAIGSSINVEE